MKGHRFWLIVGVVLIAATGLGGWLHAVGSSSPITASVSAASGAGTVGGVVVNAAGPVTGARVRVRATENLTFTAPGGHFLLRNVPTGQQIEVAAWYTGHYITSTLVTPSVSGLTLTLRPYHTTDHPGYAWSSPISGTSSTACGNCHPMIVNQWAVNAHGQAVSNPRFYSLYDGTDISGTATVAPGYQLDIPGTAGSCANCHAPGAAIDGYLSTNMNAVRDGITATIHCDFCHKVGGVYLNPATQSVYANAPGVQSQRVLRPPPGDNIFFGPYDDIKDPDTFLPLISKSAFCAPCHQFSFWGTPIYESYNEWLSSPYAAAGITCQNCHMPPTGDSHFALPEKGGLPHPPEAIPSHLQLGAASQELLQQTVTMTVEAHQVGDRIRVTAVITNTGAGHHVPTDHPGRHLILTLQAQDDQGRVLSQLSGPAVADWGGAQAGLPGQVYAKVLQDVQTGAFPVVSYWKQSLILGDNRLAAGDSDRSVYDFAAPAPGRSVTVSAVLRFRRSFQSDMDARGWAVPDTVMVEAQAEVAIQPHWKLCLPLIWR